MRRDLLLGLNAEITPINLVFKAYHSTVAPVLYNFQISIYENKILLQKLLSYMMWSGRHGHQI